MSPEDLRRRAEAALGGGNDVEGGAPLSREELASLVHELSVHQIELELQNEELRRSEHELSTARDRYFELFDLAPVGYASIDREGVVREANLILGEWIGRPRAAVLGHHFSRWLAFAHVAAYHRFRRGLFEGQPRAVLEVELAGGDERPKHPVRLRGVSTGSAEALLVVEDLRGQREAERLEEGFAQRLLELQAAERERVAVALHDGIGQLLSAVDVGLSLVERPGSDEGAARLVALRGLVHQAMADVRQLARGLHTTLVDDLGLVPALRALVEATKAATSTNVELELELEPAVQLPAAPGRLVYRAAQEGVANALHHAGASRIRVRLGASSRELMLSVEDDGAGPSLRDGGVRHGMGLWSLTRRARAVGGTLTLEPVSAGGGARLVVRVPVAPPGGEDSGP